MVRRRKTANKTNSKSLFLPDDLPRDRGWAWMCVLGCFTMNFFVVGAAAKSFGVLFVEFLERFDASSGATAWISALSQFLALSSGPIVNMLALRFSCRRIVFIGGIVCCIGFILSMFAPSMEYLYFSYGILVGIGSGFSYSPSIVMVGLYFDKRRALANGIAVAGSGMGNIAMPPLMRILLDYFGLQGALLILGSLMLHICISAMLFRPIDYYAGKKPKESEDCSHQGKVEEVQNTGVDRAVSLLSESEEEDHGMSDTRMSKSTCSVDGSSANYRLSGCCKAFEWSLLKNPLFMLYGISVFLSFTGYPNIFIMIPAHAKDISISKTNSALLLSILGVTDIFGRLLFGWFSDLNLVNKKYIYWSSLLLTGVCHYFVQFLTSFVSMTVYCAVVGVLSGCFVALIPVMVADKLGPERLPSGFGLIVLFMGIPFLYTQTVAGILRDVTGNWICSFLYSGTALILGSCVLLLEPLVERFQARRHSQSFTINPDDIRSAKTTTQENNTKV